MRVTFGYQCGLVGMTTAIPIAIEISHHAFDRVQLSDAIPEWAVIASLLFSCRALFALVTDALDSYIRT